MSNLKILRRLKIWQKLALIAVFMSVPIPVVTYLYVAEKNNAIEIARKEIHGAQYLAPIKSIAKEVSRRRGLINAYLRGDALARSQALDAERAVDQGFAAAEEMDQKEIAGLGQSYGEALQTTNQFRAAKRQWEALKSRAFSGRPEESFAEHSRLIVEALSLINQAADQSTLVLDPDFDSYYLMYATVTRVPELAEDLGQLRDLGLGIATARAMSQGELAQVIGLLGEARTGLKDFERAMNSAYRSNTALKERQGDVAGLAVRESEAFLNLAEQRLVRDPSVGIAPSEYAGGGGVAIERLLKADDLALQDLDALLRARIDRVAGERNFILGLILLGLIMTTATVTIIARGITRQTDVISGLIANITQGNLEARAEALSEDELGRTAMAFNAMLDNTRGLIQSRDERDHIQRAIMKLLDEVSGVAEGDLTREAEVTADITGAIADAFNHMLVELRQLISQVQRMTYEVTSTASESRAVTELLAQGSQQQAAQINDTSAALNTMTVSIQRVSEDAVNSAAVADQALAGARRGAEAVENTVRGMARIQEQVQETARRMRQLEERSEEIEEIVQLINEIADRTGVLALNASIQASAAGEAGQGFSVVAVEVEHLARRSLDATQRISNLVQAIQGGTGEAIAAMEETTKEVVAGARLAAQAGHSLAEIEAVSRRLAESVQAISRASQQQAQGSETLSRSMAEIAAVTEQTASGVMQSAVTVKNLAELADQLRSSVASFRLPAGLANGHGSGNGGGRGRR